MLALGFQPSAIVAADGVLWAEDHEQTSSVYAIDPATGQSRVTIKLGRPCDVIAAFDRIWVGDFDEKALDWIDPSTGKVGGMVRGLSWPCGQQAIGKSIWLAVYDGIARVDPLSGAVTKTTLGGPAFPGAGTGVWAIRSSSGDLIRVDPSNGKVTQTIPSPGGQIEPPALVGGLGALWVGGTGTVVRLDPKTGAIQARIPTATPTRLLVTSNGVWLTSFTAGVVERIDAASNAVVYRATLDGQPNGLAAGLGAIWVGTTGSGRIYRIDPAATGLTE